MDYPVGAAITAEELTTNPYPALAMLREAEPVSWVPATRGNGTPEGLISRKPGALWAQLHH